MNGEQLRDQIREIHRVVPCDIKGRLPAPDLWERLDAWFEGVAGCGETMDEIFPREKFAAYLEALQRGVRGVVEAAASITQQIMATKLEDTLATRTFLMAGMLGAEQVDTMFNVLTVLCEAIGMRDGSVPFPGEAYTAYWELRDRILLAAMQAKGEQALDDPATTHHIDAWSLDA